MEFLGPVLMFAIGFGAALVVRRLVSAARRRGGTGNLPLKKGSVRLDEVKKKRRR